MHPGVRSRRVLGADKAAPDPVLSHLHLSRSTRDYHRSLPLQRQQLHQQPCLLYHLAMDLSENSSATRGRGKNKKKWTMAEDDVLINALDEISLDPRWKGDSGYKNGYCSVLDARLAEKISNCGISAVPHIESRVRHFRTKFGAIEVMLNKSGFSWDESKKMIQCEKSQYEKHCEHHPEARGLYGITFPYYDTLSAIYGRDIATGEGAEGIGEAIGNLEEELATEHGNQRKEEEEDERMSRETPRQSVDSASSSLKRRKTNRKEKEGTSGDSFLDMLNEVQGDLRGVATNVGKMAAAMERETVIQEKALNEDPQQNLREKAVAELRKLGFTGTEQIKAAAVFVKMPEQMSMLLTLDESLRREFILDMLSEEERRRRMEGGTRLGVCYLSLYARS